MTILFPLILALPAYYFLNKTKIFRSLNVLEKFVLVLASSISVVNLLLVYLGWFSSIGVKTVAAIVFVLCLALLLSSSKSIIKEILTVLRFVFRNKVYKLLFIFLFVLLIKVTIFYVLHPVIDPDIVSQYLTYARDIALSNRIPNFDSFTLNPVTTPPVGGPILFSFYYFITGNLQSEGFRLFTYPFFLGIVALTFLISKKLFGKTWFALLSCIVFLSIPLIDTMLLEWVLYPDIIAVFLELTIVYFLIFKKQDVNKKNNLTLAIILGLSAAETLLLKSQSILFFVMTVILILLKTKIFKHNSYVIGCLLTIGILLFPLTNLLGLQFFRLGNIDALSYLLLTTPIFLILFFGYKYRKSDVEIKPIRLVIIGAVSVLGAFWLFRNYFLFGGLLAANSTGIYKDMLLQYQIFIKNTAGNINMARMQSFNNIALIALPVFGSLFVIPKIIGIVVAVPKRHWNTTVLVVMLWYALVVIYSGFPNERYLFVILPFLSALIVYGIKYIDDKILRIISFGKEKLFGLIAVTSFAIFSLSQSIILSWGFGTILFSPSELRQIAFSSNMGTLKLIELPKESLASIARLLNIRLGTLSNTDAVPLIVLSVFISLAILVCTFILIKSISLSKLKKYLIFTSTLIIIPYLLFVLQMSGGKVNNYSDEVEQKLYSYWGEANTVVPYFKNNSDTSSIVLVVGPQTGISYKTFMKVYNIEFGYGFIGISPIVKENNLEIIYKYFKEKNIRYVLVYEGLDNEAYLRNFEINTTMYNFIKDHKYFTTEIFPDENNLWRLYKLRDKI